MAILRSTLTLVACGSFLLAGCGSSADAMNAVKNQAQESVSGSSAVVKSAANEVTLKPFLSDTQRESCGYKDLQGNVVVEPIYDTCGIMSEGMAFVGVFLDDLAGQYSVGYINHLGNIAIPVSNIVENNWALDIRNFSEGLVAMEKGGKWGYLNKAGEVVIDYTYDSAKDFKGGVAVASLDGIGAGLIDKTGRTTVQFKYADISDFEDGYAVAKDLRSGKYGVIDSNGRNYGGFIWDEALWFSEGLAAVATATGKPGEFKWGFIDESGEVVIKPKYDLAAADMGGDSTGGIGGFFRDGAVDVYNETSDSFSIITIDRNGNELKEDVFANMVSAFSN